MTTHTNNTDLPLPPAGLRRARSNAFTYAPNEPNSESRVRLLMAANEVAGISVEEFARRDPIFARQRNELLFRDIIAALRKRTSSPFECREEAGLGRKRSRYDEDEDRDSPTMFTGQKPPRIRT